jgi:hypothetical protein
MGAQPGGSMTTKKVTRAERKRGSMEGHYSISFEFQTAPLIVSGVHPKHFYGESDLPRIPERVEGLPFLALRVKEEGKQPFDKLRGTALVNSGATT